MLRHRIEHARRVDDPVGPAVHVAAGLLVVAVIAPPVPRPRCRGSRAGRRACSPRRRPGSPATACPSGCRRNSSRAGRSRALPLSPPCRRGRRRACHRLARNRSFTTFSGARNCAPRSTYVRPELQRCGAGRGVVERGQDSASSPDPPAPRQLHHQFARAVRPAGPGRPWRRYGAVRAGSRACRSSHAARPSTHSRVRR